MILLFHCLKLILKSFPTSRLSTVFTIIAHNQIMAEPSD